VQIQEKLEKIQLQNTLWVKFKVSRPILELNTDAFVALINEQATFTHNGKMSRLPSEEFRFSTAERCYKWRYGMK
jgi:hypothetical protein